MNLQWRSTTKEDCMEFNRWSEKDNLKVKTNNVLKGVDNLDEYLGVNSYGGLGNLVRNFVNDEEYGFFMLKTALLDNSPVGMVLVNRDPKYDPPVLECMMFAVSPECQGKGIGTAMLFDMVKEPEKLFGVKNCKFVSYVRQDNIASQKAFTKAGFRDSGINPMLKKMGVKAKATKFSLEVKGENDERKI